jgi:hypothetical protein
VRWHFIRELYEAGKIAVKFVRSEKNEADINTKNVSVKLLDVLACNVREGNLFARQNWDEIVNEIDSQSVLLVHSLVQREDVEIWIRDCEESRITQSRSVRRVCRTDVEETNVGAKTYHVE